MEVDDPEDSVALFYHNYKKQTSEYEPVRHLQTDGQQAVEVAVVRKRQTILERAAGYWPISQTQKVQEFVRKTYLLGDASTGQNLGVLRQLQREYDILRTIEHPYIVRLTDFEIIPTPSEGTKAYLYTPYCSYGDLTQYVGTGRIWETRLRPTLSTSQFWQIFRQLSTALLYCQYGISTWEEKGLVMDPSWSRAIFHRDIKPANVVISELTDQEIKIKLCDFGYSRIVSAKVSGSVVGTHGYIAPEITEYCQNWTEKCDIYSLGRTMFALLLSLPISEEERKEMRMKFQDCFHTKPESRPKIVPIFEITTAEVYKKEDFHIDVLEYLQADKLPLLASLHQAGMRLDRQLLQDNDSHEHLQLLRALFLNSAGPPTKRSNHLRQIRRLLLQAIFICASMRYKASQWKNKVPISHIATVESTTIAEIPALTKRYVIPLGQPDEHPETNLAPMQDPQDESESSKKTPRGKLTSNRDDQVDLKTQPPTDIKARVSEDWLIDQVRPSPRVQINAKTLPTRSIQTNTSSSPLGDNIQTSEEGQVNSKTLPNTSIQANAAAGIKGGMAQPNQEAQVNPKTQTVIETEGNTPAIRIKVSPVSNREVLLRPKDHRRDSNDPRPLSRDLVEARSETQIRPNSAPVAPIMSPFPQRPNNQVPPVSSYSMIETPIQGEISIERQQQRQQQRQEHRQRVQQQQQEQEQEQRPRIHDLTPPEILTEFDCLRKLTTYSTFLIRKNVPAIENEGRGTWANANVTEQFFEQEHIIREIKRLDKSGKSVVDKKIALKPFQQAQVDAVMGRLVSEESDGAFEWSLVQLDSVIQTVRLRLREVRETATITVFVKRAPYSWIDSVALYKNIGYRNNSRQLEFETGLPRQRHDSILTSQPAITSNVIQFPPQSRSSSLANTGTFGPANQRERLLVNDMPWSSENRRDRITYSAEQSSTNEHRQRRPSIIDSSSRRDRRGRSRSYSGERPRQFMPESLNHDDEQDRRRTYWAKQSRMNEMNEPLERRPSINDLSNPRERRGRLRSYSEERLRQSFVETSSRNDGRDQLISNTGGWQPRINEQLERRPSITDISSRRERRESVRTQSEEYLQQAMIETSNRNDGRDHSRTYTEGQQPRMQDPRLQYGTHGTVLQPSYGLPGTNPETSQFNQMYQSPQLRQDWQPRVQYPFEQRHEEFRPQSSRILQPPTPEPLGQRRDKHSQQVQAMIH